MDTQAHVETTESLSQSRFERRRSDRFRVEFPATYRPGFGLSFGKGRGVQIGESGMLVQSRQPLPLGFELEVDLELVMPLRVRLGHDVGAMVIDGAPTTQSVRVNGTVSRCMPSSDGTYNIGIEFDDDVDQASADAIVRYIDYVRERPRIS